MAYLQILKGSQPRRIEVTKDKNVVWSWHDFKNFGNSTPVQSVLGAKK